MSYTSYSFALFVILTVCVYYIVRKKWQWVVLLVASMFFYLCAGPALSIYLLLFCLATWYGAKRIGRRKSGMQVSEKMLGLLAVFLIFINIGVLFILKWSGMELALLNRLFGTSLGWRFVMPLGMSFFTFQNTSYVIDVYKGKIQAERNFFHYLLYASYFPYIVSGPINRYAKMERQFFAGHAFDKERFYQGLLRILWGYLKEMVIADRAAIYVEEVFGHYYMYRGLFILIAVLLFSL